MSIYGYRLPQPTITRAQEATMSEHLFTQEQSLAMYTWIQGLVMSAPNSAQEQKAWAKFGRNAQLKAALFLTSLQSPNVTPAQYIIKHTSHGWYNIIFQDNIANPVITKVWGKDAAQQKADALNKQVNP